MISHNNNSKGLSCWIQGPVLGYSMMVAYMVEYEGAVKDYACFSYYHD